MRLAAGPEGRCDDVLRCHTSELSPTPELFLDERVERNPLEVAVPLSASQPQVEELLLAAQGLLLRSPQLLRVVDRQILKDASRASRQPFLSDGDSTSITRSAALSAPPASKTWARQYCKAGSNKAQQKTREVDGTPADLNIRCTAPQLPGEGQRRWNAHLEVEPREDLILALQDGTQLNLAMADVAENPLPMPRRELVCARELHLRADRTQQNSLHVRGLDGPREGRVEAVESEHDAVQDGIVEPERGEGLHHPIYQLCPLAPADGRAELRLPPRQLCPLAPAEGGAELCPPFRSHELRKLVLGTEDRVNEVPKHSSDGDVGIVRPAKLPDIARDVGGAVDDELYDDHAVDAEKGRVNMVQDSRVLVSSKTSPSCKNRWLCAGIPQCRAMRIFAASMVVVPRQRSSQTKLPDIMKACNKNTSVGFGVSGAWNASFCACCFPQPPSICAL
eukprot:CAMPEP_0177552116 /NCGR_PEP_ID=MMETSP0369-20130122/66614_1 /TAXON_ID=447022 ORGANISM="Scrippsiella hangoei-like, Strain SHHI-4" /NCGR_SAMPLE_ID=MMETSP0369 /ASSEMBLY_ACC=CAM_ASM_000364 /LENGTH=449 /DNA_ID=CAMNT_0019037723 /DNA_START=307 /DNA_END=1655 /DNA_ORIENTATION=+